MGVLVPSDFANRIAGHGTLESPTPKSASVLKESLQAEISCDRPMLDNNDSIAGDRGTRSASSR